MRYAVIPMLVLIAACGKKEPATKPAPTSASGQVVTGVEVAPGVTRYEFPEPPEDVFVDLMVAAAAWGKNLNGGRSTGVYQPEAADPKFTRAVQAATDRYALRPIHPAEYGVVCQSGGNNTSITGKSGRCSMKLVDAVLAFNSIRQGKDSGYVGMSITRVPTGQNKSEQVFYCVTLAREGTAWKPRHNERVQDPKRCFRRAP